MRHYKSLRRMKGSKNVNRTRRACKRWAGWLLLLMALLPVPSLAQMAPVNIWEGTSVRHRVLLTPYLAKGSQRPAVIVCPGGSYFWHDMVNEGDSVGRWLQRNGISAFVLHYRTAYVPAFIFHYRLLLRGNRYPDAINDLRQAMRYVRRQADRW